MISWFPLFFPLRVCPPPTNNYCEMATLALLDVVLIPKRAFLQIPDIQLSLSLSSVCVCIADAHLRAQGSHRGGSFLAARHLHQGVV